MRTGRLFAFALAGLAAISAGAAQDKISSSGTDFEDLIAAAQQAQRQNDLSTAALRYREALKMRPEIPELHANLGLLEYQLGDGGAASHEFQNALRLKPSLFVPNLFLGIGCLKRNDPSAALKYLTQADRLNPQDLEVNLSLGRAYTLLNEDSEAILAFSKAVALQPGNEDGWYGLGTSYLNRAESLSDLLAKRYLDSAAFRALSASYFDDQGKYERAISEYRGIASDSKSPACSHARLGFSLLHEGQVAEAEHEFKSEWDTRDCRALARIGLARAEVQKGNASAALAMLVRAADDDKEEFKANAFEFWKDLPPDTVRTFNESLGDGGLGQDAGAIVKSSLQTALKDDRAADFSDSEASGWNDHARAFLTGHYRAASAVGEKLIKSGIAGPETLYWTVRADQRLGASALSQAVSVAPQSARIHLLAGDLYRRKGQYLAAKQEYQEALKLDKDNVAALLGLATTLYLDGDSAAAEETANRALANQHDDVELRLLMAEILLAQHRYEEAYKFVDPIPNGKPDVVAEIHGVRGKIFAATHRPGEAITELKNAAGHDPQGDLTYVLARQYQAVGDERSAELAFQRSNLLRKRFNERASSKFEVRDGN